MFLHLGLFFPSFFFTFKTHTYPTPLLPSTITLFSSLLSLHFHHSITPSHIPDHTYTHHDYHKQGQADHLRHHPQRRRTGKHIETPTSYYRPRRTMPINPPFSNNCPTIPSLLCSNPPHQLTRHHHHHQHLFFLIVSWSYSYSKRKDRDCQAALSPRSRCPRGWISRCLAGRL